MLICLHCFVKSMVDSYTNCVAIMYIWQYAMHGMESSILLLQTCLDHLNIYEKDLKNMKLHPVYASIFKHILDKPNFCTILSGSLRAVAINEELLQNLSVALQLSVPEKIGIGLALSNSEEHDIRMCG